MVSADGAPRGPTLGPAAQSLCLPVPRGPAPRGPPLGPEAFCGATSARRGSGTQGIRHPGSQPWGPCSASPMFVHAQGTLHPVGHHWGP